MKNRKIVLFAGAAMTLISLIGASLFYFVICTKNNTDNKGQKKTELIRQEGSTNEKDERSGTSGKQKNEEENFIKVHDIGYLYYLAPEADQEFQEKLYSYLTEHGIKAESADVLDYYIDARNKEEEPAQFFLKVEDQYHFIVKVSFEKRSGKYSYSLIKEADPFMGKLRELTEVTNTEYEIPESYEDEKVIDTKVVIHDPEKILSKFADMEELQRQVKSFFLSENEGRRNLYLYSVTTTENGYKAVLNFETVRNDGRNVEVVYDGAYHFRFI